MSDSFVISASHTKPVPAGTVVHLNAFLKPPDGEQASAFADRFDFHWRIVGPFTNEVHEVVTPGPSYDWDTEGLRAGAFAIRCSLKEKERATQAGDVAELAPAESPPTPSSMLVAGGQPSSSLAPAPGGAPLPATVSNELTFFVTAPAAVSQDGVVPVSLQRTAMIPSEDQALWVIIRNRTDAISFSNYRDFIDDVMGTGRVPPAPRGQERQVAFRGANAYLLLKYATEFFLMHEAGVLDLDRIADDGGFAGAARLESDEAMASIEQAFEEDSGERYEEQRRLGRRVSVAELRRLRSAYYEQLKDENVAVLPYLKIIRDRLKDIPLKSPTELPRSAYGILRSHLTGPLAMELIWSYWHEEGMLVQTLNAILARFQNRKLVEGPDPLARFDLDPLRPLNNLFWGWAQDEFNRLTVRRRAFEYDHEYGLKLFGKAIPALESADSRSKFLEAFHNLLLLCQVFFKEDDDTTVIADGFPVLNALRETHLLLAEGAHNQFGDLPSTARAEMLVMQWLLARPEMRDFLGGKIMVPYAEPWMDRVDTMKAMQGWTDVSITHFRDLGVFGEQILLSIRYGNWSTENDPQKAANWARYWRPEIQRYTHAYRSSTGVDLTERVDATLPAILLRRRLASGRRDHRQLPSGAVRAGVLPAGRESRRVP